MANGGRRAWLVMKRLNMVQYDWRCIEVDPVERCFRNKIPMLPGSSEAGKPQAMTMGLLQKSNSMARKPRVTEKELLSFDTVRKTLYFDDIALVNRHELDLRVTIQFHSGQKPYNIEFSFSRERDEFLGVLRQNVSRDVFQAKLMHNDARSGKRRGLDEDNFILMGRGGEAVPEAELATFYRGLCLKLTIQLDRTRTECIRISRLKALTDTDALMMIYDEREQLRQHSTKIFGLPESEKMVLASKCFLSTEEESEQHLRRRLIILTNFLVMDTAIFGPTISSTGSSLLRIDQLFDVSDSEQGGGTENRLETASHSFYLKTVNDVGNSQSWKIAFATASTAHQVRMSLSDMCSRARHLRQMLRDRPFEDNVVKRLIEKVGMIHYLVEGQELVEARSSDSLFLVRSGGVTQRCDKLVYRMLREGSCFGETNFAKGCISSQFSVHASRTSISVCASGIRFAKCSIAAYSSLWRPHTLARGACLRKRKISTQIQITPR